MKNIKLFHISLSICFLFLVYSCSDDEVDTEKPTITINEPENNQHLHPGGKIHANIDFSDNDGLASWKIDIHWAGDGHEHGHAAVGTQDEDTHNKWEKKLTGSLSGQKNAHIHEHINIPKDIEDGKHHFCVYAVDKTGNESTACLDLDIVNHDKH